MRATLPSHIIRLFKIKFDNKNSVLYFPSQQSQITRIGSRNDVLKHDFVA